MWVSRYFVWFVAYSVLGWVWESTYCTIQERKWENRGFLYGPACPIYGTGVVCAMAAWQAVTNAGIVPPWWMVFLVCMAGSAVLEYFTHWALERLFNAYWWDYRDMPLNLNGRICLPASILFGLAGLMVVYVLYQPTMDVTARLSPLLVEASSLFLMAVLAADTAVTAASLTTFAHAAASINKSVNDHMDQFVAGAVERGEAAAGQLSAAAGQVAAAAGQLQERGVAAASQLQERGVVAANQLQERSAAAADALARERAAFANTIRSSRVGEMSLAVRSTMARVRGIATPASPQELPSAEELRQLLSRIHDGL